MLVYLEELKNATTFLFQLTFNEKMCLFEHAHNNMHMI